MTTIDNARPPKVKPGGKTGFHPLPGLTDLIEHSSEMLAVVNSVAAAREAGCRPDSILSAVRVGLTGEKVLGDDRWRLERVEDEATNA